jgi:hypothetical protein
MENGPEAELGMQMEADRNEAEDKVAHLNETKRTKTQDVRPGVK